MERTLQSIILEKLCKALTDIVGDVVKLCKLDPVLEGVLTTNLASIKSIIDLTSSHGSNTVPYSLPPSQTNNDTIETVASTSKKSSAKNTPMEPRTIPVRLTRKRNHVNDSDVPENIIKKGRRAGNSVAVNSDSSGVPTQVEPSTSSAVENHSVAVNNDSSGVPTQIVPSTSSTVENQQSTPPESISNNLELELIAIVPVKKIFLSNFPSETTDKAIQNHIRRKIPAEHLENVVVDKMDLNGDRKYSSFIVTVGDNLEIFNKMIEPTFWPAHSIVHEFNYNKRKPNFHQGRGYKKRK